MSAARAGAAPRLPQSAAEQPPKGEGPVKKGLLGREGRPARLQGPALAAPPSPGPRPLALRRRGVLVRVGPGSGAGGRAVGRGLSAPRESVEGVTAHPPSSPGWGESRRGAAVSPWPFTGKPTPDRRQPHGPVVAAIAPWAPGPSPAGRRWEQTPGPPTPPPGSRPMGSRNLPARLSPASQQIPAWPSPPWGAGTPCGPGADPGGAPVRAQGRLRCGRGGGASGLSFCFSARKVFGRAVREPPLSDRPEPARSIPGAFPGHPRNPAGAPPEHSQSPPRASLVPLPELLPVPIPALSRPSPALAAAQDPRRGVAVPHA